MKFHRRATVALFLYVGIGLNILATPIIAANPEVFAPNGIAINGYDAVAYFVERTHKKGSANFSTTYNNVLWHFKSAENKAAFEANPQKYEPQYGGYCAYAVSQGYTASTKPDAWSIVDNKLYLNYNLAVRRIWNKDQNGYINKANKNWPHVLK